MSLNTVRLEKIVAAATAKAEVLEAAALEEGLDVGLDNVDLPSDDAEARTKDYVEGVIHYSPTTNTEHAPDRISEGKTSQHRDNVNSYRRSFTPAAELSNQHHCSPAYAQHSPTQHLATEGDIIEQFVPRHTNYMPIAMSHVPQFAYNSDNFDVYMLWVVCCSHLVAKVSNRCTPHPNRTTIPLLLHLLL
ncbi:uncharacterized protein V6R79_010168 [Siganus canaliculatus]